MGFRKGRSGATGKVNVELPSDEVPAGVSTVRRQGFAKDMSPEAQRERAKKGGRNKAAWRKAMEGFSYSHVAAQPEFAPYMELAKDFAHEEMARLAQFVGGGRCSVGPGAMVVNAALALAVSRWAAAQLAATSDMKYMTMFSKMNDAFRLNITTAQALTASEAKSRSIPGNPVVDLVKALNDGEGVRAQEGAPLLTMYDPEKDEPSEG